MKSTRGKKYPYNDCIFLFYVVDSVKYYGSRRWDDPKWKSFNRMCKNLKRQVRSKKGRPEAIRCLMKRLRGMSYDDKSQYELYCYHYGEGSARGLDYESVMKELERMSNE